MQFFSSWNEAVVSSLQNIWSKVLGFLPELIGALVVLIVGLIVASVLGRLAEKIVEYTRVDRLVHKLGVSQKFEEVGVKFTVSGIVGWIVKWFFIIAVLIAVVDIIHLEQVTGFLRDVALYIPNVVVAVIILVIGLVVGQFVYQVVEKSAKASNLTKSAADILAAIAKWAIVIFALMAGLTQLGIATRLIEILFTGLVATLTVSFGLAFGLGGRDHAKKYLDDLSRRRGR